MSINKQEEGMQDKFVNLGNWLSSLVDKYLDDESSSKAEATIALSNYFQSEENYLTLYFSLIPGMISTEKSRGIITKVRNLKNSEDRKEAVSAILEKAKITKVFIDTLLAIPEDELDGIVRKFSLYVNLFTDMYMTKK